jgi:hypothetical protein
MTSSEMHSDPASSAARWAGFAFLAAIAVVILANYGVNFRLIVPGDAALTARNILAHGTLFRLNLGCNLVYAALMLALAATLYTVLRPVQGSVALVAAACRMVLALMWTITALNSLGALRLLEGTPYLSTFGMDQAQVLARLQLASSYDAYYVGLPFWGLASTLCCWLWFRSRYIPRWLAVSGLLASAWAVGCAFAFLVFPRFGLIVGASWFDVPLLLFELALGLRLAIKRLGPAAGPFEV